MGQKVCRHFRRTTYLNTVAMEISSLLKAKEIMARKEMDVNKNRVSGKQRLLKSKVHRARSDWSANSVVKVS